MTEPTLSLYLFGDVTPETVVKAQAAFVGLVDAVTEQMRGSADAIKWHGEGWKRSCDRCGWQLPFGPLPEGWTNDGTYDHCDACTGEAAA